VPIPGCASSQDQVLHGFVCGVGVNFQLDCQRPHRRERLPWLKLAADEGLNGREYDLLKNRLARFKAEAQKCHTHTVTHITVASRARCRQGRMDLAHHGGAFA
jgi:hypothetical protein